MTSSEADFVASREFKKGRDWEVTSKEILERLEYQVYHNHELPDLFVIKDGRACWVECKAKPKMLYHPATGFQQSAFEKYQRVERLTELPVFVVFEDDAERYGNRLSILNEHIYRKYWAVGKGSPIITFDYPAAFIELGPDSNWAYMLSEVI